jgi:hypothetical protein
VEEESWVLSGEKVEVRSRYKYLGVDTLTNAADWNAHVERVIAGARKSRETCSGCASKTRDCAHGQLQPCGKPW